MNMQTSDISARLLATENLSVVRANARTASFDIKSRVLTLPMWKEMTPDIEDMLIGHEVGHALYTSMEKYQDPIKENPKLRSYMNIIEDVRIEKLIKQKYPGLRKRMTEGYRQLNERDFFGVKSTPLDTLLLIDRINLYFKAGFSCGVKFTPEEMLLVKRAERINTIEEVVELAKEIYAYSQSQAEERKKQLLESGDIDIEEDEEPEYDDFGDEVQDEYDDGEYDEEETDFGDEELDDGSSIGAGDRKENEQEEDLESKTDRAFQDKLEELADQDTVYKYHNVVPFDDEADILVGYKTILKDLNYDDLENNDEYRETWYHRRNFGYKEESEVEAIIADDLHKFKGSTVSSVNYLVKEFEMKKSAQLYKRAQTSKIGSLDMKKIWSYKLQDDLFKRVTTLPQGKNHGMIFLLDWSGSMQDCIADTIKQVISLAMFCNKAQIPYQVLAFSTQYYGDDAWRDRRSIRQQEMYRRMRAAAEEESVEGNLIASENFSLLEFFNHKMTSSEFNRMVEKITDPRIFGFTKYDLGGTPLNEALVWTYFEIPKFMKRYNVEKMNLITLTDGQGSGLNSTVGLSRWGKTYDQTLNKYVTHKHLVRDAATQKTYMFGHESSIQTETLIKMIKDRYNIRVVGFYITTGHRRHLNNVIHDNVYDYRGNAFIMIEQMKKDFRQKGFYSMGGTGRDDLFIIPQSSTKIQETELQADGDMSARKLASNLSKYMNVKKTSRVLLSRFIDYVA